MEPLPRIFCFCRPGGILTKGRRGRSGPPRRPVLSDWGWALWDLGGGAQPPQRGLSPRLSRRNIHLVPVRCRFAGVHWLGWALLGEWGGLRFGVGEIQFRVLFIILLKPEPNQALSNLHASASALPSLKWPILLVANSSLVSSLPQALHQPWCLPNPFRAPEPLFQASPHTWCLLPFSPVPNATAVFVCLMQIAPLPPYFLLIFVSLAPSTGSGTQ